MLSEPLAFAYAGWMMGTGLIIFFGFITCYTYVKKFSLTPCILIQRFERAKILARIIATDPSLRTYADIGFKAFGRRSTVLTGSLFCLEIFAVRYVLYANHSHIILLPSPQCSPYDSVWRLHASRPT